MGARAGECEVLAGAEDDGELSRGVWKARGDGGWPELLVKLAGAEGAQAQNQGSLVAEGVWRLGRKVKETHAFYRA